MKRQWLISIRKEKCLTQEDVAESVGLTRQMISAIEQGQSTQCKTAKKLAAYLDIEWTKFFE